MKSDNTTVRNNRTVDEIVGKAMNEIMFMVQNHLELEGSDYDVIQSFIKEPFEQTLQDYRKEVVEEERKNIPTAFLRQWLNEDRITDRKMVTDENLMTFIELGYKALLPDKK